MSSQKPKRPLNKYARYSGVAFQMIAIIVLSTYAGLKLDDAYPNNYRLYTIIFSLVGVAISMYFVIKQVGQNQNKNKP
jgi:F0F1-type ATP synthase assembly protein I